MTFNEKAVNSIAHFEEKLYTHQLSAIDLNNLNSILNAVECHVEDKQFVKENEEVISHLFMALEKRIELLPKLASKTISQDLHDLRKKIIK